MDTVVLADCVFDIRSWPLLIQTLKSIAPKEIWLANAECRMSNAFFRRADLWVWEEITPPKGNTHVFGVRVYWGRLAASSSDLKCRPVSSKESTHWCACDGFGPSPPVHLFTAIQQSIAPLAIEDSPAQLQAAVD